MFEVDLVPPLDRLAPPPMASPRRLAQIALLLPLGNLLHLPPKAAPIREDEPHDAMIVT